MGGGGGGGGGGTLRYFATGGICYCRQGGVIEMPGVTRMLLFRRRHYCNKCDAMVSDSAEAGRWRRLSACRPSASICVRVSVLRSWSE